MMIKISLPFPPSVNALYAGKVRRYKSKRYVEWEADARYKLIPQRKNIKQLPDGPIQITYRCGRPDKRVRDLANLEKALSDFLVHEFVIRDDSDIHRLVMEWASVDGVEIEIISIDLGDTKPPKTFTY